LKQDVKNQTQKYNELNTNYGKLNGNLTQCSMAKSAVDQDLSQCQTAKGEVDQDLTQCQTAKSAVVQNLTQCQTDKGKLAQQLKQLRTQLASQESKTTIVINEIAWMGTTKDVNDEWIELYNYGDSLINLGGWKLIVSKNEGGWKRKKWETQLSGKIGGGQFLILRQADNHNRLSLDRWNNPTFSGVLWNKGVQPNKVSLKLIYKNQKIDQVDQWYDGKDDSYHRSTMERKNPKVAGNNPSNWCTASVSNYNWQGEKKPYDTGTPGTQNTCAKE